MFSACFGEILHNRVLLVLWLGVGDSFIRDVRRSFCSVLNQKFSELWVNKVIIFLTNQICFKHFKQSRCFSFCWLLLIIRSRRLFLLGGRSLGFLRSILRLTVLYRFRFSVGQAPRSRGLVLLQSFKRLDSQSGSGFWELTFETYSFEPNVDSLLVWVVGAFIVQ